jgi:phosphohistidine phosphatase
MSENTDNTRRLIIVRHARAAQQPPGGGPDRLRPLTDRGEADIRAAARRMVQAGIVADLIVSSPATRTDGTARIVADALRVDPAAIDYAPEAYNASLGDLLDVIAGTDPDVRRLLIVGHNPGLSELADLLIANGVVPGLPTSGIVAIDLPLEDWSAIGRARGTLVYQNFD